MKLISKNIIDGQPIGEDYAFGAYDPENHVRLTANTSPHLAWSGAPTGTQSFALLVHDPDVPSRADDVNQEGRTVPHDLPRVDFFHLGTALEQGIQQPATPSALWHCLATATEAALTAREHSGERGAQTGNARADGECRPPRRAAAWR